MIIYRKKLNDLKSYTYHEKNINGKLINDKTTLAYLQSLVIPPAYNDVIIFYEKSPKILFQGYDVKERLQQIYSPKWRAQADKEKFKSLIDFGKKLPVMTSIMMKNIKSQKITKDKLISMILYITILCGFRIGSMKYQKLYGSVGLITLQPRHIKIKNGANKTHIDFIGKKGVKNSCVITEEFLIHEIKKLISGKSPKDYLFTYVLDEQINNVTQITAIDINNWLKSFNPDFTSKFFRNYSVNTKFIEIMQSATNPIKLTLQQRKKMVVEVIKELSCSINNTPTICKKSYLDPNLVKMYLEHPKKYMTIMDSNIDYSKKYIKFLELIH